MTKVWGYKVIKKRMSRIVLVRAVVLASILFVTPSFAQEAEPQEIYNEKDFQPIAKLQGLNKITARVSPIETKIADISKFGNLEISVLKCWKAPPEEQPESKALIRIWEQVPGEDKKEIFSGWMFASSPAISALEHPVYDITLLECYDPDHVAKPVADDSKKPDENAKPIKSE